MSPIFKSFLFLYLFLLLVSCSCTKANAQTKISPSQIDPKATGPATKQPVLFACLPSGNTYTCGSAVIVGATLAIVNGQLTLIIPQPFFFSETAETPAGLVNGTNTIFVLTNNVCFSGACTGQQHGALALYKNGLVQTETTDYTFDGLKTITFVVAPAAGDAIIARYF